VAAQRKLVKVRGRTSLETVRRGTGSQHESLVLMTDKGERFLLKALGKNPFEIDRTGPKPGEDVEVEGYVVGKELRYKTLRKL